MNGSPVQFVARRATAGQLEITVARPGDQAAALLELYRTMHLMFPAAGPAPDRATLKVDCVTPPGN